MLKKTLWKNQANTRQNIPRIATRGFDNILFRKTGFKTIFVFHKNEGRVSRVSQFRETAEITKETGKKIK